MPEVGATVYGKVVEVIIILSCMKCNQSPLDKLSPTFLSCVKRLTEKLRPYCFSTLVLNLYMYVLLGSGCSHNFLGMANSCDDMMDVVLSLSTYCDSQNEPTAPIQQIF